MIVQASLSYLPAGLKTLYEVRKELQALLLFLKTSGQGAPLELA